MEYDFTCLGTRLLSRLKKLDLKQADLCRDTGLSTTAISQYCTGKRIPDTASLYKMSITLKTSMEWLLTGCNLTSEDLTSEDLFCDGDPLTELEADLIAMYRLLPEEHREEIFELISFKYKHYVESKKESFYSTYTKTKSDDNKTTNYSFMVPGE